MYHTLLSFNLYLLYNVIERILRGKKKQKNGNFFKEGISEKRNRRQK